MFYTVFVCVERCAQTLDVSKDVCVCVLMGGKPRATPLSKYKHTRKHSPTIILAAQHTKSIQPSALPPHLAQWRWQISESVRNALCTCVYLCEFVYVPISCPVCCVCVCVIAHAYDMLGRRIRSVEMWRSQCDIDDVDSIAI